MAGRGVVVVLMLLCDREHMAIMHTVIYVTGLRPTHDLESDQPAFLPLRGPERRCLQIRLVDRIHILHNPSCCYFRKDGHILDVRSQSFRKRHRHVCFYWAGTKIVKRGMIVLLRTELTRWKRWLSLCSHPGFYGQDD